MNTSSSEFWCLNNFSVLLWAIALVVYTYTVATRARFSMPPCPCEDYAAAFLPLNGTNVLPDLGNEFACYDAVRWALQQEKRPKGFNINSTVLGMGTKRRNRMWQNKTNREMRNVGNTNVKGVMKFYGRVGDEGEDPPDREAYISFFAENEDKRGVFVDVGAGDGLKGSTTRFFEESLGWAGLLIDGGVVIKRKGNRTTLIQEVICEPKMEKNKMRWVGNGTSQGIKQYMSDYHVKKYEGEWGKRWRENVRMVTCVGLGSVLEKEGIGAVDLMVVSVNGAERPVLLGLDGNKVHVRVVVVKVGNGDGNREREVRKTLLEKGFCFSHRVGRNEFWVGDDALKLAHCAWSALREDP